MGTHGNPWEPMGTHGDPWGPMGTHRNPVGQALLAGLSWSKKLTKLNKKHKNRKSRNLDKNGPGLMFMGFW